MKQVHFGVIACGAIACGAIACGILVCTTARAAILEQERFMRLPVDDVTTYQRSLAKIEASAGHSGAISPSLYKTFNWVGRTAAMNYACSVQSLEQCRRLLSIGVTDRALVVRDHALKLILASSKHTPEEKAQVAHDMLEDPRNYRFGAPMWIIDRARKFLEGFKS